MQEENRAAELEQSLKEKMDSLPCSSLIRDIVVTKDEAGESLEVAIIPEGDIFTFDALRISLAGAGSGKQWRRKKKAILGNMKGFQPKVRQDLFDKIREEAESCLFAWREEHPLTAPMAAFLSSKEASLYMGAWKMDALLFLLGKEKLRPSKTAVTDGEIRVDFKNVPCRAVFDIESGEISFPLVSISAMYQDLVQAQKEAAVGDAVREYLRQKRIRASVRYAGKSGAFAITFHFDLYAEDLRPQAYEKPPVQEEISAAAAGRGSREQQRTSLKNRIQDDEEETVVIESSYKRVVLAAFRSARVRAVEKRKELAAALRACPYYGTCLSQAILTSIRENGNRLTQKQVVNLLRGVNIDDGHVFGFFSGKYRMITAGEICAVMDSLEEAGILRRFFVHGDYRNYYAYSVTPQGELFSSMQENAVPGQNPATEQEIRLFLSTVREDIPRLTEAKKEKILETLAEKPGLFLTDPRLALDCAERMGPPGAAFLREHYTKEAPWTAEEADAGKARPKKEILHLLINAASGKGKTLPKNGMDAYWERKEKERRKREEAERKDRELFELVLTEIPDNYIDLYPAARLMHRQFILHIGPTNSGKTYEAVEDLMRADSGIYLAPLRLLAYEQYDKMNRAQCPCSLVTGEEQYLIEGAKHQSSTIEMLDLKKRCEVAVIDEAQMIADDARGGAWAAAVMGACADRIHVCAAPEAEERLIKIIRDCGDEYTVIRHMRMTPLVYEKKPFIFPDSVKAGDALIVFSRQNVHAVAAQLRNRQIRCSIIYGALPYDVRHKQAELFAEGENEVVVATDAIGMGMNLPIRRVVLMETEKFDGFVRRPLKYEEIRQIIGRAGRYGIYNVGYAIAANGDENVQKAMDAGLWPIKRAVIDFPEALLTIDASILELIKKWEQIIPADGWKKESVEQMHRLAEMTQKLGAPKRLAYDFLTIPFDDENDELLRIWYDAFEKEAAGVEYDLYDQVEAMAIRKPSSTGAIDELEQQHRVLDLYFNLARKFQPQQSTLDFILEKKRICSERIMKVLEKQGFKARRCKACGKLLPWNHPYRVCYSCYNKKKGE